MTKIISWDMDGVIADTATVMTKKMNQILDAKGIAHGEISFDRFTGWTYVVEEMEKYTGDHKLAVETDRLFLDPDFLIEAEVFNGVEAVFLQLSKIPVMNIVTTSRPAPCQEKTLQWLSQNGLLKHFDKVNFQLGNSISDEFKINSVKESGALLHFDDSPKVVRVLDNSWLIDRPWNKDAIDLNNRRLCSWEDVLKKIEEY